MATIRHRPLRSGVVVPHELRWHGRLAARMIYWIVRLCAATLRLRLEDRSGCFRGASSPRSPVIFCLFHNRLATALPIRRAIFAGQHPLPPVAAMVSASRDGGLLARVLTLDGFQPVRGSSSRRGPQALLELQTWAKRGYYLSITPDGPRGPCYVVQDGAIALAQVTGLPIVPVNCWLQWKWRMKSWDRFQIPLPFSRCAAILGEPVRVPAEADDAQREALRQTLETRMRALAPED